MALALLFAYLFLVAQYESWMIPVPVMLTVAFAVIGALLGLLLTGETMSIYAQLGMVMLIGLAAKNAILMVEFSKQERESGRSVFEAAMNGANLRYPRGADDRMELPLRRLPAGDRHRRRIRQPPRHRNHHLLRHGGRHAGRHHLHPIDIRIRSSGSASRSKGNFISAPLRNLWRMQNSPAPVSGASLS